MATGCAWDLFAFGKNLDASGGDVATVIAAGEELYAGNGAAGTGTLVYPVEDGQVVGFCGASEDGALVNYRWRKNDDPNWVGGTFFQGAQGEAAELNKRFGRINYPITTGDSLQATLTNAAAKMDSLLLIIGKGGTIPTFSSQPFGNLPANGRWIEANGAFTATADTWTRGALAFPDFTHDRNRSYKILASVFSGATLQAYRFRFSGDSPDTGNEPGFIGATTDQLACPVWYSHAPQYKGSDPPRLSVLCTAGDTAQPGMLYIVPV